MRVDFVFPKFKRLSGAERLILSLGGALAARGHHVRVLCHRFDPSCRPLAAGLHIEETGARLEWTGNHYLDSALAYALALRLRSGIDAAADVVCLFGPALVLAWRWPRRPPRLFYFCYEPPRAADIDSADVLARVGPWRWVLGPALRSYRAIDRWLVARVDAVLVNGEHGRQRVAAAYGRPSWPITHGVTLPPLGDTREAAREKLGLDPRARVAMNAGFLHPRKRVDLLLRVWTHVERENPEAWLLVIGEGPEGEALRSLARSLSLERVKFCGFVPEAELPRCYRASDVLVHVAREETFGLTILEAAAFAVPSVVVDEGGPRYTVSDGESGVRVPATEEAIAQAVVALLADPDRCRRLGERARMLLAERFSWTRGADDFLAACEATGAGQP